MLVVFASYFTFLAGLLRELLLRSTAKTNPSLNNRYMLTALFGRFGFRKTAVVRALGAGTPFVLFCSTTFYQPCKRFAFAYPG
jgi:hypothetical protein